MKVKLLLIMLLMTLIGCSRSNRQEMKLIQSKGSDTMVNIAQAWAEKYRQIRPEISVAVSGGGSGTGVAALINGTTDMANCSRSIKPEEEKSIKEHSGKKAIGAVVAWDALAIFVHKNNPLNEITLAELACIYGEKGACDHWNKLHAITVKGCNGNQIIRVSRQSNSGTYQYFREAILGDKGDFKLGSRDMNGSKEAADLVANTPCAIGYSGMGYLNDQIKVLCIKKNSKSPCILPTIKTAQNRSYPIARELFVYTLENPREDVKNYLDWMLSAEGQKVVADLGFVPVTK